MSKRIHFRCGEEVTSNRELISDGYSYACLYCDEDLYSFETEEKTK